jgi:hypothetical protein
VTPRSAYSGRHVNDHRDAQTADLIGGYSQATAMIISHGA